MKKRTGAALRRESGGEAGRAGKATQRSKFGEAPSSLSTERSVLDPVRDGFAPVIELYQRLKALPFVDSVHANRGTDGFEVWVVVSQTDAPQREQIYECEWKTMERYRNVGLDVRLVEGDAEQEIDLFLRRHFEISLRVPDQSKVATSADPMAKLSISG